MKVKEVIEVEEIKVLNVLVGLFSTLNVSEVYYHKYLPSYINCLRNILFTVHDWCIYIHGFFQWGVNYEIHE